MAAKDTLRGAAILDWDYSLAITSWQGVTVSGSPRRVIQLRLNGLDLTGGIPTQLKGLTALNDFGASGLPNC